MHAEMWRTRGGAVAARGRGRPRTQDAGGSIILRTAVIRYAPRAVGLKPSAKQGEAHLRGRFQTNPHPCLSVISVPIRIPALRGEARLRGLYRIISSKTISPRLSKAKPACAGDSRQTFIRAYPSYPCQSVFSSGSSRRSPPARAIPDHYIQRPYQRNCTSYLCTRFAALCPQCVPWRDDGGCATWRCASLAPFHSPA
jgi:hypothetical protein